MKKVPLNRVILDQFAALALLSDEEVNILNARVEVIMGYKRKNGEPPAVMEALYEYLHKRHIAKAAKITNMQNMYKK